MTTKNTEKHEPSDAKPTQVKRPAEAPVDTPVEEAIVSSGPAWGGSPTPDS